MCGDLYWTLVSPLTVEDQFQGLYVCLCLSVNPKGRPDLVGGCLIEFAGTGSAAVNII